jgi:Ca2+-transporting ATPase
LQRREQYGSNELQQKAKRSLFRTVLDQFKDVMIIVLIAAALLGIIFGIIKKVQNEDE